MAEPATNRQVSAGAYSTSDIVDDRDTLGFAPYVQAVVDFVTSEKTRAPLTTSIEGTWGSGKTSFMRQMIKKLEDQNARIIKFNAWRHDKSESLWAAFAMALVDQLRAQMRWHCHEEAIKEYIRAREIDPNDPDAYFRRGLLYEESGVPEKAVTMYEEAMEHGAGVDTQKRIEQIKQKMAVTENAPPEGSDEADSKIQ